LSWRQWGHGGDDSVGIEGGAGTVDGVGDNGSVGEEVLEGLSD